MEFTKECAITHKFSVHHMIMGRRIVSAPTVCMHGMLDVVPPQIPTVRYARNLVNVVRN